MRCGVVVRSFGLLLSLAVWVPAVGAELVPLDRLDPQLRRLVVPEAGPVRRSPRLVPVDGPWLERGQVHVAVRLTAASPESEAALRAAGLTATRRTGTTVEGWLPASGLAGLAVLAEVRSVRPVRPGRLRATADIPARADLARATGYDGTGVVVGVISDGVDGLPSATVPVDCDRGGGSEGRAMIEIVKTLAPGVTTLFSEGLSSSTAFIDSVACLQAAGANVIVDDIGFFDQPFFEDGDVAQAVSTAVAAGISFHSAAGNEAEVHYGAPFCPTAGSAYHDFACGGRVDNNDNIEVAPMQQLDCVLQWNDPWGASGNDYDLELYDMETTPPTLVTSSNGTQTGTQDPFEAISVRNDSGSVAHAGVAVRKVRGADRVLSLFCFGGSGMEHVDASGSIVGHPAVAGVVAVGAIAAGDAGLNDIEPYSSRGPTTVYFPRRETREKPDVVAFDGVTTTVAGFSPFFGTSAAAPDTAAVAALLLDKNDCRTPAQIQAALTTSAVDLGAAGYDGTFGAGRLDALGAIEATGLKTCGRDAECDDGSACTVDTCEGCTCEHRATACDDGSPCTVDTCDPITGCMHADLSDGTACGDGDVCNGDEICHGGACTAGTPLTCDDGNACTTDACDPIAGCTSSSACDDGDACTTETCDPGGGCTSTPVEGFVGVACLCSRGVAPEVCGGASVPQGIAHRFTSACDAVARAAHMDGSHRARRLVRRAVNLLGQAERTTARAGRRGLLVSACSDGLGDAIAGVLARAQGLAAR